MSKTRTILILGAGTMQLPAIRAARRLGLRVVVADGNAAAPGRDEADVFRHVDLRDTDGLREVAARLKKEGNLHAVFTAGTDFSWAVATLASEFGLPGTSVESALNATDKYRMRSVLAAAGVPVPRYAVLGREEVTLHNVGRVAEDVGLPCVVKPADSMGARGVVRCNSIAEAFEHAVTALAHSRSSRVVVEGYIDGPEYSIDALVASGNIQLTGVADRHIFFPPYFIEMGHTIPAVLSQSDWERISRVFCDGVKALGIQNGAAKGDIKLGQDGPVVGEIAARLSGGYMSGWTYPLSSGVELTEKAIRIALGEAPGSLAPAWNRTSAERAVISIPGIVEKILGVEDARSVEGVSAVFVTVAPGDTVRMPTSNVEKCANVIAVADEREVAIDTAETAASRIEVTLVPGNGETLRYLLMESGGHLAYAPENIPQPWFAALGVDARDTPAAAVFDWLSGGSGTTAPAGDTRRGPVGIGPVPPNCSATDWAWRTLEDTVRHLTEAGLVTTETLDTEWAWPMWRAVLRGGLPGGRFLARTIAGA